MPQLALYGYCEVDGTTFYNGVHLDSGVDRDEAEELIRESFDLSHGRRFDLTEIRFEVCNLE